MKTEELVSYESAAKLKEAGFNELCEWIFYNHYRVRNEIYEKYPDLSDDGYEGLRQKYGGPYKDSELYGYYIEPVNLHSRNSTIGINPVTKSKVATGELCSCPTIHQAAKWFRKEKNIEVVSSFSYGRKVWGYQIGNMNLSEDSILAYDYSYPTYEKALEAGIGRALEILFENKNNQEPKEEKP